MAAWLDLNYKPPLPASRDIGIAIVGAGEIVQSAHLPAYRKAGFHVVGIHDIHHARAQTVADEFDIPRVYASLGEIVHDSDVQIVDIAVGAKAQPSIVQQVVEGGKHVLCQKPLAETYQQACQIVKMCDEAGVRAGVNQQMRYAPGIRASKDVISRGWLGELLQASIQVNVRTPFEHWSFLRDIETLEVMYHSIHYLDSIRYLLGTPEYVYADGARYPGAVCRGETRTLIHLKFPGEVRGFIHDNHDNWASEEDWYATFRFEGTRGIIKGTNGALYDYPHGRTDTISILSKEIDDVCWLTPKLGGRWFPDAFMGTMGELMAAIEEEREPENSVRDNLLTLQMVFASYLSMTENRPVWLDEIEGRVPK